MSGVLSAIGALVLGAGVGSFVTTLIIEKKVSSQKNSSPAMDRQSDLEDTKKKIESVSKSVEETKKRVDSICNQLSDYSEKQKKVATSETGQASQTRDFRGRSSQEQLEEDAVLEAERGFASLNSGSGRIPSSRGGEVPFPPRSSFGQQQSTPDSFSQSEYGYENQQQEYSRDSDLSSQPVQDEYITEQEQQYMDEPEQQNLAENPPQEEQPQKTRCTMEDIFKVVKRLREDSPQYYTYNKSACRFDSVSNKDAPYIMSMHTTGKIMLPNETSQFRATKLQDKPYTCSTKQVVDGSFVIEEFCVVNDALEIISVGRIVN